MHIVQFYIFKTPCFTCNMNLLPYLLHFFVSIGEERYMKSFGVSVAILTIIIVTLTVKFVRQRMEDHSVMIKDNRKKQKESRKHGKRK